VKEFLLRFFSKNIEKGAPSLYNNSNQTKLKGGTPYGYYNWKKIDFKSNLKINFNGSDLTSNSGMLMMQMIYGLIFHFRLYWENKFWLLNLLFQD
jgi:hypothetical protein